MTISEIIKNCEGSLRDEESRIQPNGDYAISYRTYRLTRVFAENLAIVECYDGGFEDDEDEIEFDHDMLMYRYDDGTWCNILAGVPGGGATVADQLRDGSGYREIRIGVGILGDLFADHIRSIVDSNGGV